jgi:hypothetical protein
MPPPSLLLEWEENTLRWDASPVGPADPSLSALWIDYQAAAEVCHGGVWTLPGAPSGGGRSDLPAMARLLEPMAHFERGLERLEKLPARTPCDDLVGCAMRLGRAQLALELAAERLKFSFQEAYDIHREVMGPATREVVKPYALVMRWLGALGILGITNQRWSEVKATLVCLSQLLKLPLEKADRVEMEQFAATLLQRSAQKLEGPEAGEWFAALKAELDPETAITSWLGVPS